MKKLFLILGVFALIICSTDIAYADIYTGYNTSISSDDETVFSVGDKVYLTISSKNIQGHDDGEGIYEKYVYGFPVRIVGTLYYDSAFLKYESAEVGQGSACCYTSAEVSTERINDDSVSILLDTQEGSTYGYNDFVIVTFEVIAVPESGVTKVAFSGDWNNPSMESIFEYESNSVFIVENKLI